MYASTMVLRAFMTPTMGPPMSIPAKTQRFWKFGVEACNRVGYFSSETDHVKHVAGVIMEL